jgi:16S rRNA (adenine1518-N6/adenine1519-N6)-dimethyltransferase
LKLHDLTEIRPLLERHGFHFSKSMGQNFLIQEWVPKRILQVSGIDRETGVLEIGPGIGVLTQELCGAAGKVMTIELDRALLPVLDETLSKFDNLEIVNGDVLKLPLRQLIAEKLPQKKLAACANLPYNITTPVLRALLELECFQQITVMIQKEVAQRICAKPGTPEYGAFTVFVNYYASPSICFDVPPDCFYPRPKVTSSVITLKTFSRDAAIEEREFFFSVTRAAFSQRRKTLVNGLSSLTAGKLSKEQLQDAIVSCGFQPLVRGETLSLEDFMRLSRLLKQMIV